MTALLTHILETQPDNHCTPALGNTMMLGGLDSVSLCVHCVYRYTLIPGI